jgi:flagellar biosynthetic protein FliO
VARYRKKIVVFSVIAALSGYVLVARHAQLAEAEPAKPLSDDTSPLFANDPKPTVKPADNSGTRELFFKMMLSVLLVVVLGVTAIYISKKFLPGITNLSGKEVRVVETVHLGPRRAVHLLKVGNKRLLIGSTNESITKLADITGVSEDLSSQGTNENLRI